MSRALVSEADYQKHFKRARVVMTGLHREDKVIGAIEPAFDEPSLCIWCVTDPVTSLHHPFCSAACIVQAQKDSL